MGYRDPLDCVDIMHDPLAVESLLDDTLLHWRRGRASVELCGGATYGYTTFAEDANGPHRYADAVDDLGALALWLERVLAYRGSWL
jgi:inosine-uridine nucleoside N-ribohydrolase